MRTFIVASLALSLALASAANLRGDDIKTQFTVRARVRSRARACGVWLLLPIWRCVRSPRARARHRRPAARAPCRRCGA